MIQAVTVDRDTDLFVGKESASHGGGSVSSRDVIGVARLPAGEYIAFSVSPSPHTLKGHPMHAPKTPPSSRVAFWSVLAMLAMIAAPVGITLSTVKVSALRPLSELLPGNPSPNGYTVSLLIFIVPILLIAFWFLPNDHIRIAKNSFWKTLAVLFPLGAGLDFFFAHRFFQFPNRNAVLGISAPAAGGPIPIEEYFFYFAGFLAVLLFYVWLDGYWLHAYSVPDHDLRRSSFRRLLGFHPDSLVLAVFLISAAIVYKNIASTRTAGFPGYATFLILGPLMPSAALFPVARTVINWRALSLTLFIILLLSLQWEATLAVPYGWWIYQDTEMVGIHIRAWDNLPIEAVFVWGAVTYTTVIVYEVVRCWQASGKSATHAFLGKGPANHAADAN
jgi:hypothetical protein